MTATIIGSTIVSTIGQLIGSQSASSAQQSAAQSAQQTAQSNYGQIRSDLSPYTATGDLAANALIGLTGLEPGATGPGPLLSPITMDEKNLQQTPGYQFNLKQGLKAVQNSAAARGLGASGAALKGAAGFASGLADSTYQNQFANAQQNQGNQFNRLLSLTQLGENAASQTGSFGTQTAQSVANSQIGAGNAQAAGDVGSATAVSNGVNSATSNSLLLALLNRGGGGGSTGLTGMFA